METALLQKTQEQEMMLSPASSTIPTSGCSQGAASFAQERIWLDEKIHHNPSISPAMHNFVLPLVVKHGSMPIERIRSAIVAVLKQHEILRTAIYFDENRNMLVQAVQSVDNNDPYSFEITTNGVQSPDEVADLLRNESVKHFAELEHGLVVRCHLVKVGYDDDMDKLYPQDLVIFIFHGVAFDYNSIGPFPAAFEKAYDQMELDVESEMKSIAKTNNATLSLYTEQPWLHGYGIASHDMNLKMIHNQSSQTTYCILECSADCYDEMAVANIGRYFQNLLLHVFTENMKTIGFDPIFEKIGNLSLLPMNVETLSNVLESLQNFSEIKPASYAQQQIWFDEERHLHLDGPQLATYNMVFCYRLSDAVIEKHMPMIGASMFWHDALHDCKLDQSLALPYDRYRLSNEHRTDRGTSISFDFDRDLCNTFLQYTSSQNISVEHLTLSLYFVFLFKLTDGQTDLCIGMNVDGRYRDELKLMIGMLANVVPLRCQLDPQWFLHELVKHVQEILTNSRKYSYFPLQRLLDQHPHASNPAFLDISFELMQYSPQDLGKYVIVGDSYLSVVPISIKISEGDIMSKSDFILSIQYDLDMNQLSCIISASLDLFNQETVKKMSQRFHSIVQQLSASIIHNQMNRPIYEVSLILSNEQYLMQSLNNTQISFSSPHTCIHHEFVYQVMKHPQKQAVELDEQSLTYCELLYYVQILSLALLNEYQVFPGEVVCQCVERSLSMVIGIMGIEMAGGVYCPLSPRDPQHRLLALTRQTQSRLVLVHHLTKIKFSHDILLLNINSVLVDTETNDNIQISRLSNVVITLENIAYIIFTSGSTGTPKPTQLRHNNFIQSIQSLLHIDLFNGTHIVVQMARCSFDLHVQEILGALIIGATVIMLHPKGNFDFEYLSMVMATKQITFLYTVPTLLQAFFNFIKDTNKVHVMQHLRSLCTGGERCSVRLVELLESIIVDDCSTWNLCGPAETTLQSLFHRIDSQMDTVTIPLGKPLPNYSCILANNFGLPVFIGQEGEILVRGVGIFAGYLGRDDLTAKALIEIDGQLYYRTGDLVTIDNNGLLHYQGRKDHQIKLHGQRIELGEIERCLLNITSISACVVMKWNDDYLVAYVQSSSSSRINEEQLRQHCQSHLPPHMIPSFFIILDKLPLNANGKIDRKQLPSPTFTHLLSNQLKHNIELLLPTNDIEVSIHRIWCEIFKQNQISTDTNIFTIGGHSLLLMQLFHRYKIEFHLETKQSTLSISNLFQHPTIIHHAQLVQQSINIVHTLDDYAWSSLHLVQTRASFAQERIYLDEQIRFSSKETMNNMYVIPLLYRISSVNDHISITRLQHAFQSVIIKHQILRTALYLDTNGTIIQHCLDTGVRIIDQKSFRFSVINIFNEDHEQNEIVMEILNQSDLFDLSIGHVINCHILRHFQANHSFVQNNDDLLTKGDLILFTIHHAVFDGASTSIFTRDLSLAYQSNDFPPIDDNSLQYIDYSTHEHILDMTLSQEFWRLELKGYNFSRQLSLSADRQRSSADQRSGLASSAQITFDNDLCTQFLNYASAHRLTLFQLGLSIFYVFLFKLTHGESELCVSSVNANRYRNELQNLVGMFVSTLPYRLQIDSHWSFDELIQNVREKCLSILEHSHYPLQHILSDLHHTPSNVSFLETMFDFINVSKDFEYLSLKNVNLERISLEELAEVAKFDFLFTFEYNPLSKNKRLSCGFVCSHDLFNKSTVSKIAERFHYLFQQLFEAKPDSASVIDISSPMEKLSLILPEEAEEMKLLAEQQEYLFVFVIARETYTYTTQEQLNHVIHEENYNPHLFNLAQGLVFRCHIVYYKQISSNHLLSHKDLLIFNFHHALFDFPSMELFLHDLNQAYTTGQLLYGDNSNLRYLDYAVIEQQMTMTGASMFWLDALHDCKLDQPLPLPFDQYRLANEHRTGRGTSISFDFGQDLSHHFLIYASSNNISLEYLALT
ncbi:unnamed protein product, partial [Adineta steineri]